MRIVLVSQRVESVASRDETRDCLDRAVVTFLGCCGYAACPVPNVPEVAGALWDVAVPAAVVLTGGGTITSLSGEIGPRDLTEEFLVTRAQEAGVPVVGICRGLQFLVTRAGGHVRPVLGHVATSHRIDMRDGSARTVNSFHEWGIDRLPVGWTALAHDTAGHPEAAWDATTRAGGVMWHPERAEAADPRDVALVQQMLAGASPE